MPKIDESRPFLPVNIAVITVSDTRSAADDSDSRIQMIATLVRKLGHEDAVAALVPVLDHPSFFVRWHVMRELLGLDAAAALPQLKRMAARDPHPEARRAARTVLDRLESAPSEKREAA